MTDYPEDIMEDNVAWLEDAQAWFTEAVETENWGLARAIIADVRDVAPASAAMLELNLSEKQNAV